MAVMRSWSWILGFIGGVIVLGFLAYAGLVDTIDTPFAVGGGVGVALIAAWLWLDRSALSAWSGERGSRYTGSALLVTVLGLAVAVAVNVIAFRYDKRWDVTSTKRFSLSDQTKSVLAGLDKPITISAFFTLESQAEREQFETLTEGYKQHSTLITIEMHDPLKEPALAEQNKITSAYGTVILRSGDKDQRLESKFDEESLTNAIVRLSSGKEHIVCFSEGHSELDPDDDQSAAGMGAAIVKLEGQNYTVKKSNLLRDGGVPADCEVLVIPAPQQDWLPPEREMLASYLVGGGKALMLLEPLSTPGLAHDLSRYGVAVGDDLVLEQSPNNQLLGGDPSYIVLDPSSFDFHKITEPIKGAALLRVARSVDKGPDVAGVNVQVLAHTTDAAWAETNLDPNVPMGPDPGADRVGQIPLVVVAEITDPAGIAVGSMALSSDLAGILARAAGGAKDEAAAADPASAPAPAATDPAPPPTDPAAAAPAAEVARAAGGKLVVFGDSDFAMNELVDQVNNQDLLLNSLAWLVGEDSQISIRSPEGASGSLSMTLVQGIIMGFITLIVAPGVAIMMAISTWRRRRSA